LTGIDTDRLPEEKRRGITIDLGFASLETGAPDKSLLRLSFIDVPGHKLFIRNMLAGAGGIDAVMLVISAEEGVKPQTEEHLAICSMLGVTRGLTVISKCDAVSTSRLTEIRHEIEHFLAPTFLNNHVLIPVSAFSGQGLQELHSELISLATQIPDRDSRMLPRLPLDRSFVMKGFGTVVTGTLISGTFKNGQTIEIEPGARTARIRGMQVHGHPEEQILAGSRVAMNLIGVDAPDIHRGQTLVEASSVAAVDVVDAEVILLPHSPRLKHRSSVHFHAFSTETLASISLYEYQPVEAGTKRLVRLKFNDPVVLLPGDRFVIRQSSPAMTIGGGQVIDAHPVPNLSKAKCLAWLNELKDAPVEQQLYLRIARRGTAGISLREISAETGWTEEAIRSLTTHLTSEGTLWKVSDDILLAGRAGIEAVVSIMTAIEQHTTSSGAGLKRAEMRIRTKLSVQVFNYLLEKLAYEKRLQIRDESVHLYGSDEQLPERDTKLLSAVALTYEAAGLASPPPEEVAKKLAINKEDMRRLMVLLLKNRTLTKLGNENLYVHQLALQGLLSRLAAHRGQSIDIGQFKQLTGLSRKYAIPLLEYLDREHITRKQGEHRLVL